MILLKLLAQFDQKGIQKGDQTSEEILYAALGKGGSLGFGDVEFVDPEGAMVATSKNGHILKTYKIRVEVAAEMPSSDSGRFGTPPAQGK